MPIMDSKNLRSTQSITNQNIINRSSNIYNKTEIVDNSIVDDLNKNGVESSSPFPGMIAPPLNAEGNEYQLDSNGKYASNTNTQAPITEEQINNATDFGRNTQPVYDRGIDALLADSNPGQTPPTSSGSSTPNNPTGAAPVTSSVAGATPFSVDSNNSSPGNSAGGGKPYMGDVVTGSSRLVGQQLWEYEVTFNNLKQRPYPLAAHAIKQLVIEDDTLTWPIRGYVIVDCREEGFERSFTDKYYHVRSDARDEINIKIYPNPASGSFPDKIWKIETTGVIYDVEDLLSDNNTTKMKKFYFWDKQFQKMFEKNFQWSTATTKIRKWSPICPVPEAHATDEERSMWTGDAILSLLKEVEVPVDDAKWDRGLSKINFTCRADWTVWENLLYMIKFHVSEEKQDNCILEWNRADMKLNFLPFYKKFEKAGKGSPGELQIEHFFFEEKAPKMEDGSVVSPFKAPYNKASGKEVDIKVDYYNSIMNYRFSQTAGSDSSQAFTTAPVHSHWHKQKQFDIDVYENEIEHIKNSYFLDNYVSKLMGSDYPVMVLNQTKKKHESTHPIFVSRSAGPMFESAKARSLGRAQIMYGGIHLNQCLILRVQGGTHRLAGTFVGVDRLRQKSDTNYDYALCGQYYVVNVKHVIQQQKYVNDLQLVKVHAFSALQNNEDVW